MSGSGPNDQLTNTLFEAIQTLPTPRKAEFLLNISLDLIDQGKYGNQVENFLDVYLHTPGLSSNDATRAHLARGRARSEAAEKLLLKARHDFQSALKSDPSNRELQLCMRRDTLRHFSHEPVYQRAPPEIWERIALHIPRYHLRTWLFVSSFHRDIALRLIFHTIDLYFGEDQENLNRGLDIFDRVKSDPLFARRVKSLRLHWAYEESDMLDLMMRIFRAALPEFKALRDFEWIGYPEMRAEAVQTVLASHSHLQSLGLIGWHFDAVGVSAFRKLRKFTLRAEDDDGFADMGEVRAVLDQNAQSLRHLCLGAYLARNHSWDSAFQSVTIQNLTHLDLVDTRISHIVFARIAHAHNLQSLTLHGTFEEPSSAAVVFGLDHIIDGKHTFLPHLETFRFLPVGHDEAIALYQSVTRSLQRREKLRSLDLGGCPSGMVLAILPELKGLRVLRIRIPKLTSVALQTLVDSLPSSMSALHLLAGSCDHPLHKVARAFSRFVSLSFLHLRIIGHQRLRPIRPQKEDHHARQSTDASKHFVTSDAVDAAQIVATLLPSLDFVGWHGEHYVVVRNGSSVELKELPFRRRLDCGKGVDLGGEDAKWLERKDVPIDYEMDSGLEC